MEPIDYVRILQRRWMVVAAALLLGLAAGFFTAANEDDAPERFQATHTLSVVQPSVSALSTTGTSFTPSQLAVYATLGEVPERAAEQLDFDGSGTELVGLITTAPDDQLGILELTATSTSADQAAAVANAFGNQLKQVVAGDRRTSVQAEITTTRGEVDDLQNRIAELDGQLALLPPNAAVLTAQRDALVNQYRLAYDNLQSLRAQDQAADAVFTLERAVPQPVDQGGFSLPEGRPARTTIFGLIGLLLGTALALVLDRVDTRIRTKADAEATTGYPVLAEIPYLPRRHRGELVTATRPASPFAEAYRNLRTTLSFASAPQARSTPESTNGSHEPTAPPEPAPEPEVILVTSPGPYEGKTTTVAHLAASYAESNRSVLVLDCDFRRPRLHRVFGTRESPGLSDTLNDPTRYSADSEIISDTSVDGVRLVPAGTPTDNPARLFTRARTLIEASRRQADIVLIDTPPFLVANDAAELLPYVDAMVLVIQARRTSRETAARIGEQLERRHAPVVGVVLVGAEEARAGYSTYYYYRATARTEKARRGWRRLFRLGPPKGAEPTPMADPDETPDGEAEEPTPDPSPVADLPAPDPSVATAEDHDEATTPSS